MEEQRKRTDISELGEFGLIDHLTEDTLIKRESTIKGIGDDAAVIDSGDHYTLITTDMLVEGIHFDLAYTPLKHLGYKCIIVNLSDIYAMNAVPTHVTVSLAISNRFSVEALEELYEGINLACELYNVDLVGGDTTASLSGLIISVTAVGIANKGKLAFRSLAKPGNAICLTGNVGAAYLGLQILEREKSIFLEHPTIQPELEDHQYLIERFLKPEARRDTIAWFEQHNIVPTSMIDVSDGLASEMLHICKQSGVGANIFEAQLPIHPDTYKLAIDFNIDPVTCALHGGEDYELLFTIDDKDIDEVRYMPDVFIIGNITPANEGIRLTTSSDVTHPLSAQGWNHFKK